MPTKTERPPETQGPSAANQAFCLGHVPCVLAHGLLG